MNNQTNRNALLRELMSDPTPARRLHLHRELLRPNFAFVSGDQPAMRSDRGRIVRTQPREVYGFVPRPPSRAPQIAALLMAAVLVVGLVMLLCPR